MVKAILLLLVSITASAAVSTSDRALVERGNNLLRNGGFEQGKVDWTASAGTFATTTTAANVGKGSVAATWDAAASGNTLTSSAVAIPAGLYGRNGVASCLIQGASATHTLQAYDGSNILASQTISSQSAYSRTSVNFIYPSSGNIQLRLYANADEPSVAIDDCFLGDADGYNISQISQAQLIVSARRSSSDQNVATSAGAVAVFNSESIDSLGEFNTSTGIFTAQVAGNVSVSSGIRILNGTSGQYLTLAVRKNSSSVCTSESFQAATTQIVNGSECSFSVVVGDTIDVFVQNGSDANYDISNSTATYVAIKRFPTSSETAYRADVMNWKVDASIYGANPSLGTSAVSSYTGIENSGLTLENNSGRNNLTAQIPCSSTNSPSGTTCSSGSESVGVSFTIPQATDVLACASFSWSASSNASGVVFTTFQIVETPSNAQTILQEGKGKVQAGQNLNGGSSLAMGMPFRVCGNFTFSSAGQKTLRLMYEQAVAGTVISSTVTGDRSATGGQPDIHWEVYPINQAMNFPALVGSVTSNSSGQERVERAAIICSGSSSIASQSGSWLSSIGNISSGTCTITIASGIFSGGYSCVLTKRGTLSATTHQTLNVDPVSATSLVVGASLSSSGSSTIAASSGFNADLICMGAK